jgi:TrmH family RNA methyltransferase
MLLRCVILISTLYGIYKTEPITSAANPLIKDLRRAVSRGERTGDGLWVSEGFHLLEEAQRSKREIPAVVASESALARVEAVLKGPVRLLVLPDPLFQSVAATETSQGVIALVRFADAPCSLFSMGFRTPATRAPWCARQRPSALPECCS